MLDYPTDLGIHRPHQLISHVTGDVIFEETAPKVAPIAGYKIQDVNRKSEELVTKHQHILEAEKLLQQRHQLRAIPVTEITYGFKGGTGMFWLHGHDRDCHFPDYPQKKLWGCNLM
jgi:hypothetical protein